MENHSNDILPQFGPPFSGDEIFVGKPNGYPPKPGFITPTGKNRVISFLVSIVLFALFYYFFLSRDWQVIAWLAAIVLIHEAGHYIAMKCFHYQDLSIFFIPLVGAVAGGSKERISQKEKAIVLLSGPVPGIVIGILLYYVSGYYGEELLRRLGYAFVLLNLLNLLPVYPLDGGQLLKTLFLGSRRLVSDIFIGSSILLIAGYAILHREWFLLIIPFFLVMRLRQQIGINAVRKKLLAQDLSMDKGFDALSDEEYWKIRDVIAAQQVLPSIGLVAGDHERLEKENEVIDFVKSVLHPLPVRDLSRAGRLVFLFIWLLSFIIPVLVMKTDW